LSRRNLAEGVSTGRFTGRPFPTVIGRGDAIIGVGKRAVSAAPN
jgi:hypothetical protein